MIGNLKKENLASDAERARSSERGTDDLLGDRGRRDPDPTEPCRTPNDEGTLDCIVDCEVRPNDIELAPVAILTNNNLKITSPAKCNLLL